jgi:hypothetical protein
VGLHPVPSQANTGQVGTAHTDLLVGQEVNYYRFEITPGTQVQGEMIVVGPPGETALFCPNIQLTDRLDQVLAWPLDPSGGEAGETFIKGTQQVVVNADEVYVKVETGGCAPHDVTGLEFDLELKLTVVS